MPATTHLRSFQALEMALRTGSLQGAAGQLGITPAAVGQRVKALEDYLGVDLLVRGRSGLKPTVCLAPALPLLAAAFRELDAAAGLLDLQQGSEIHIAAVSDFVDLWLRPRIAAFRAAHPNVLFGINGEGEAPLRLGRIDCEIAFGQPAGGDLLFRDYVAPICSPENRRRLASLEPRERLEGFPLLHLDYYKDDPAVPDLPTWIRRQRLKRTAPERGIRFQRITAVLEAVLADAGVANCGLALVSGLIDDGRLFLVAGPQSGNWTAHAFHARFRAEALARPQVRRFRDWLLAESRVTDDWLSRRFAGRPTSTPRRRR
ncbi:MAG TPA: LysR family transcriptional regulator [Caulobacteraceae bacterium]|nr:LysR family transcriptional regulator [Caulobacteraceae bacterium]